MACLDVFAQPPAPGQLIDLGGHRLHLSRAGTGSPTVVVLTGGGSFSVEWALVQPLVAKHARICVYDRAGYAWSDRGPVDDGIEQIVDDLHLLLQKVDIEPSLILTGHSLAVSFPAPTSAVMRSRWQACFLWTVLPMKV